MGHKVLNRAGYFLSAVSMTWLFNMAAGCAAKPDMGTNHIINPNLREEQGLWTISVASDALVPLFLFGDPTHNFIYLREHNGSIFLELHGGGVSWETETIQRIPNHKDTILAFVDGDYLTMGHTNKFLETEIHAGEPKDIMRTALIMIDAMHCINRQNLRYDLHEWFAPGQNSNSVAYTLIRAAGLTYPEENLREWEEGHGRWLLPEGWYSYYEDWEPPIDTPEFLEWYIDQMRERLEEVTRETVAGGPPPSGRRLFFDPENPFVPYEPLIIEDAQQCYEATLEPEAEPEAENADNSPQPNV